MHRLEILSFFSSFIFIGHLLTTPKMNPGLGLFEPGKAHTCRQLCALSKGKSSEGGRGRRAEPCW